MNDNNNHALSIWRSYKIGGCVLGRGTLHGSAVTEWSTEVQNKPPILHNDLQIDSAWLLLSNFITFSWKVCWPLYSYMEWKNFPIVLSLLTLIFFFFYRSRGNYQNEIQVATGPQCKDRLFIQGSHTYSSFWWFPAAMFRTLLRRTCWVACQNTRSNIRCVSIYWSPSGT